MAGLIGTKYSLVGMLGKQLFGKGNRRGGAKRAANKVADEREAKARKIAADREASLRPSTYRGNTTPVSTLLSGPGRSGY